MPSWSAPNPPSNEPVTLPATSAATVLERVRRLLEELFAGRPNDNVPSPPKR